MDAYDRPHNVRAWDAHHHVGSIAMSGHGGTWPVGFGTSDDGGGGDVGDGGDIGDCGDNDVKGVDDGTNFSTEATARAQALVEAARSRPDASVVAGLAETYDDEVVRAWLFGADDRHTPADNLAAEALLFTAAYQDTASGRQSRSSEVALVRAHQPPYVFGSIVDAGGPHPVASVGSQLTGVPFGTATVRRRWAVDLSSPVLEMVEVAFTDTGRLIVVERCVIPSQDDAPTLHEAIRFYSTSQMGATAESTGHPAFGTGLLQILVRPWGRHDVCTACDPRRGPVAQPCVHAVRRVRGLRLGTFRRWCCGLSAFELVGQQSMEVVPLSTAAVARSSRYRLSFDGSPAGAGLTGGRAFPTLRPLGYSYSFRMSDAAVLLWSDAARRAILGGGQDGLSSVLQLGSAPLPRVPQGGAGGLVDGGGTRFGVVGVPGAPHSLPVADGRARTGGTEEEASWNGACSDDPPVDAGLNQLPQAVEPPSGWSGMLLWPISWSATGASALLSSRDSGVISATGDCTEAGVPLDSHSSLGAASRMLDTPGSRARLPAPGSAAGAGPGPRRVPGGRRSGKDSTCAEPKASDAGSVAAVAGIGSAISATDAGHSTFELLSTRNVPPPPADAQPQIEPEWTGAVSSTALRAALEAMTATARERLASYSRTPHYVKCSTVSASDKLGTEEDDGSVGGDGGTNGAPVQPTSAQTQPAPGGTTETDNSVKTGASSRSGSAHGSGGSQSRPLTGSPSGQPPLPSAAVVAAGQEAIQVVSTVPIVAPRVDPRVEVEPPASAAAAPAGSTPRLKRPRNYGCSSPTCEAYFLSASDRDRHVNTVHYRRRDWPCGQCDFRGLQRAHLKTHVAARHGGERRFVCSHCDDGAGCTAYRSISRSAVERHVRRVHQQLRPFICNTTNCGASFAARSDLTRHKLRRHPGAAADGEEGSGSAAGRATAPPAA